MGCSKPNYMGCPRASITDPYQMCFGCRYHTFECDGTTMYYCTPVAKCINEFTTDELLVEIKRRMGT